MTMADNDQKGCARSEPPWKGSCQRSGQGRGVGQKSEGTEALLPPSVPFADFFLGAVNFDLFGNPVEAVDKEGDGRRHIKTEENALKVSSLARSGLSRVEIAAAMGIAASTLYAIYFPELGVRAGCPGRRRFQPSDADRLTVAVLRAAGKAQRDIAKALGISEPTLRLHFPRSS